MKHYPQQPDSRLKTLVDKFENLSQNKESCFLTKSEFLLCKKVEIYWLKNDYLSVGLDLAAAQEKFE
mgnify:CR=1 FL=1